MNKARISKKDPSKILKSINESRSPKNMRNSKNSSIQAKGNDSPQRAIKYINNRKAIQTKEARDSVFIQNFKQSRRNSHSLQQKQRQLNKNRMSQKYRQTLAEFQNEKSFQRNGQRGSNVRYRQYFQLSQDYENKDSDKLRQYSEKLRQQNVIGIVESNQKQRQANRKESINIKGIQIKPKNGNFETLNPQLRRSIYKGTQFLYQEISSLDQASISPQNRNININITNLNVNNNIPLSSLAVRLIGQSSDHPKTQRDEKSQNRRYSKYAYHPDPRRSNLHEVYQIRDPTQSNQKERPSRIRRNLIRSLDHQKMNKQQETAYANDKIVYRRYQLYNGRHQKKVRSQQRKGANLNQSKNKIKGLSINRTLHRKIDTSILDSADNSRQQREQNQKAKINIKKHMRLQSLPQSIRTLSSRPASNQNEVGQLPSGLSSKHQAYKFKQKAESKIDTSNIFNFKITQRIEMAKDLLNKGKNSDSLKVLASIIQRFDEFSDIEINQGQNNEFESQALFLAALNYFSLQNYQKSFEIMKKITNSVSKNQEAPKQKKQLGNRTAFKAHNYYIFAVLCILNIVKQHKDQQKLFIKALKLIEEAFQLIESQRSQQTIKLMQLKIFILHKLIQKTFNREKMKSGVDNQQFTKSTCQNLQNLFKTYRSLLRIVEQKSITKVYARESGQTSFSTNIILQPYANTKIAVSLSEQHSGLLSNYYQASIFYALRKSRLVLNLIMNESLFQAKEYKNLIQKQVSFTVQELVLVFKTERQRIEDNLKISQDEYQEFVDFQKRTQFYLTEIALNLGCLHYALRNYSNAIIIFQEGLQVSNFELQEKQFNNHNNHSNHKQSSRMNLIKLMSIVVAKIVQMIVVIKIKDHDFHQASYLFDRDFVKKLLSQQKPSKKFRRKKSKGNSRQAQPLQITFSQLLSSLYIGKCFIDSTLLFIKRDYEEGVSQMQSIKKTIQFYQTKTNNIDQSQKTGQTGNSTLSPNKHNFQTSLELQKQISSKYHVYLAYGYFSLSRFKQTKTHLQRQKQIKKTIKIQNFQKTLEYNIKLCQAMLAYQKKDYQTALIFFLQAKTYYPDKLQPTFCSAVCRVHIYQEYAPFAQSEQRKDQLGDEQVKRRAVKQEIASKHPRQNLLNEIRVDLQMSSLLVQKYGNNISSNVYFYRSIFHACQRQWKDSIKAMDIAIQKSEQNYWKFYHIRSLILASCHNFQEAIHDSLVASNLQSKQPDPYLLRAKCLQIQGEGNQAFKALQQYIALKPNDKEVHMFAGQLLFENGAFQDSLAAFQHQPIRLCLKNIDVFYTKAKTHFLLGNFDQAGKNLMLVYNLEAQKVRQMIKSGKSENFNQVNDKDLETKPNLMLFDAVMMSIISCILQQGFDDENSQKSASKSSLKSSKAKNSDWKEQGNLDNAIRSIDQLYSKSQNDFQKQGQTKNSNENYGKIFKSCQRYSFKAICYFYKKQFNQAIDYFKEAISQKQRIFQRLRRSKQQSNDSIKDQQRQLMTYCSQMYFNICLCYILLKDYEQANKTLDFIVITESSPNFKQFELFKQALKDHKIQKWRASKQQVFPIKNKLSNFLQPFQITLRCSGEEGKLEQKFLIKLCVPFPKVEPPQIFPKFDPNMIFDFDLFQIQVKSEAPWIIRQENCIKFTDKIQKYSQLQLDSQQQGGDFSEESMIYDGNKSDFWIVAPNKQAKIRHKESIKQRFILDPKVEGKLNKLIGRNQKG